MESQQPQRTRREVEPTTDPAPLPSWPIVPLTALFQFSVPMLILLANSRHGSLGRKSGKMRRAGETNPVFPDARDEFANSIQCYSRP
jgi:hypothetical protein